MSDPVYSPDGKYMWSGSEWIPVPPGTTQNASINLQDSVVSGDAIFNSNTTIYSASADAVKVALEKVSKEKNPYEYVVWPAIEIHPERKIAYADDFCYWQGQSKENAIDSMINRVTNNHEMTSQKCGQMSLYEIPKVEKQYWYINKHAEGYEIEFQEYGITEYDILNPGGFGKFGYNYGNIIIKHETELRVLVELIAEQNFPKLKSYNWNLYNSATPEKYIADKENKLKQIKEHRWQMFSIIIRIVGGLAILSIAIF